MNSNTIELKEIKLVGLSLQSKTTNELEKSSLDCGNLWQKFEKENYAGRIPNKLSDDVFAVYHEYDGDHTQPFSYFIGCKVPADAKTPEGMNSLLISEGLYQKNIARGKIPACITNTWKEIWDSETPRAYQTDFEVYDGRSKDWNNAEVDIFISVQY